MLAEHFLNPQYLADGLTAAVGDRVRVEVRDGLKPALVKGEERYIFVYDDDSRPHLIDLIRDHAADPSLSLNWFDAMVLTTKAREQEHAEAMPLEQEAGVRDQESEPRVHPRFSDS